MGEGEATTSRQRGPAAYENWRAARAGTPSLGAYEVPLFTDAHILGMITEGYGPYQLLNTIARPRAGQVSPPAIILRVEAHPTEDDELSAHDPTDDELYHGGMLSDEIAALISLALGIRLKPGGVTREFQPDGDPRGLPIAYDHERNPTLLRSARGLVLPRAVGDHSLDLVAPLARLPLFSPPDAVALIRAARLYQDGLWIVEADPALSWLLLVSAAETVASRWRAEKEPPVDRLRASRPDLEPLLVAAGGTELVAQVAAQIAPYMGATKTFIDFALRFLPDPPAARPDPFGQLSWDQDAMKKALNRVYGYRSRALHGGRPFPAPMCQPPKILGGTNVPVEVPPGITMRTLGGTWRAEDVPLHLHMFEHIVRGALLRWWASLATAT